MSAPTLKGGHLLTLGAVLFAGYALFETFKKPGGVSASQPGAIATQNTLAAYMNLQAGQAASTSNTDYMNLINLPTFNTNGVLT